MVEETQEEVEVSEGGIPDFLLSSTGDGFSMRAKALIPALIPVISVVAALLGYQIDKGSLMQLLNSLATTAALIMWIVGQSRSQIYKAHKLGKFSE